MKLKIFAGIAALAALAATPALAADMPLKAPAPVPYSWSGFYFGGDAGYQDSRIRLWSPGDPLAYTVNHGSLAGGVFVGAQRQFNQLVFGIEADWLGATGHGSLGSTSDISIFGPGGTGTAQAKLRDIWSVGGRVGWAMGRWMPYVSGGYANGAYQFSAQNVAPSVVPETETAKSSGGGGYVGVGVDWAMMNNWIIGAEYRHYGFSSQTATGAQTGAEFTGTETVKFGPHTDTVLARVSYKFDWPMH